MSKIKMLRKEAQVALPNSGETYIAEDGTVSMVLDDNHDNTYEPSEQEINEYAEWLGMSLPEDAELLWVAKEGLKAPLPKEWKPCKTDSGEVYYFNFKTGDSIWDHPMDEHFKNKFKAEKERLRKIKESGGTYSDALSKLPSRNNIVFTERGVVKHETVVSPVSTPRSSGSNEEKSTPQHRSTPAPAAASATSAPSSTTKAEATTGKGLSITTATPTTATATPAMLRKDSSGTYSTTIASASSSVSTPRGVPSEHQELQQPSPAADPQPESPRLVSEAEKILQDRIRQEVETEHKKKLAAMEEAFSTQSDALRKTHDDDIAESKRQSNVNKRNQINKIEDALQEELEQQQRNVDARSKRDIQKLQEDIEAVRERTRDIQTSANQRVETEVRDVEKRTIDALHTKVADIESEIASIRVRHAKAQLDAVEQEKQRLELEINRTVVDVRERANADYDAKTQQLRTQHDEAVARLRAEAQREMEDESRRAASVSAGGNQEALCAELKQKQQMEVERIRQRSSDELAAYRAAEEDRRATMRAQGEAEVSLILRADASGGNGSLAEQEALSQIDADADAKIRSAHDAVAASRSAWMQSAAMARQQAISRAAAAAASSGSGTVQSGQIVVEETNRLASETASLVAAAQASYDAEVAALRAALQRERSLASEGDLRSAVVAAVQSDLDAFIADEQRQRKDEEARFQGSKREAEERHNAALAAYDAKVKAVHSSAPPTTIQHVTIPARSTTIAAAAAPAIDDAMRTMRLNQEQQFEADSRRVRSEASSAHSDAMLRLADELVALEQQKRRSIDAALTDEASSYEQAALAATRASALAPTNNAQAVVGGVTLSELEERLESIRAEYRQREAAIRAEMQTRIESSRAIASSTRTAIASLRAKLAETSAPSTPEPQGRMVPPHHAPAGKPQHQQADAFDFLQEQQRGLTARQEMLAQARAEWQHDVHQLGPTMGGDGAAETALRMANHELADQEDMLSKDVHSLRALEKYYSTQVASGGGAHQRHADPTSDVAMGGSGGSAVNAQIVLALQHLNQKLEHLSNRVATISSSGGGAPPQRTRSHHRRDDEHHHGKHHHHGSSPKATTHRRSTSCDVGENSKKKRDNGAVELATKWGSILRDVAGTSKSSKMPSYEDAVRQYLHGE